MQAEGRSLRFHHRFTHLVDWGETLSLLTDTGAVIVEDPAAVAVARAIDGRLDELGLVAAAPEVPPERAHFALLVMREREIVVPVPDSAAPMPDPPEDGWSAADVLRQIWRTSGPDPTFVQVPTSRLDQGLECDGTLVIVQDYLEDQLLHFDRESLQGSHPYLVARLGRGKVGVGPRIVPGRTGCWLCVRTRLWDNLASRQVLHSERGRVFNPAPRTVRRLLHPPDARAFDVLARGLDSTAVDGSLEELIVEFSFEAAILERHRVFRRPQCARCGDPSLAPPGPDVRLQSRRRRLGLATGCRIIPASATLARLRPLVGPLTGVVRSVRRLDLGADDPLVHVYSAGHSMPLTDHLPASLKSDAADASGGKGVTPEEAEASALCEAIERQSAVFRGHEPHVRSSFEELKGRAVAPQSLLHFSDSQYADRDRTNATGTLFNWVPAPYDPREEIRWTRARSLISGSEVWVPLGFVYVGVRDSDACYMRGDSNGLAAGNCIEEAVLQGFLELIERDAVALWWYNRTRHPAVDLDSLPDSDWVQAIRDAYHRLNRDLWVLDITSDLEVPCYVAISALRRTGGQVILGFGAHLDPTIALNRALCELHQLLPSVLESPEARRARLLAEYSEALQWWEEATIGNNAYLSPTGPVVRLDRWPSVASGDICDDIELCLQRAKRIGSDVLVHDLSRPDCVLSVIRVIAPTLRHFWRRLGPGRLYEAPVEMGRLLQKLPEEELNPLSIFV